MHRNFATPYFCLVAMKPLCILSFVCLATFADAHEKWFIDSRPYPLRWDLFFRPLPMVMVAAVLLITFAVWLFWRKRQAPFIPGPEKWAASDERRSALYGLVPLLLGIHTAVPLLVSGVTGHLFSPDNELPGGWKYILGVAQTGIALALFYGAFTRLMAVALAALWFLGIFIVGIQPMLDNALYLGLAGFFFCAGRGPISIDRLVVPIYEPKPDLMSKAFPIARIGLGLSLCVVAFTEKLANMPLALGFLEKNNLNFTPAFGLPMSNEMFSLCAGCVELLVGLWILFGIFPREITLIAWLPINASLTVFNWTELVGHLPIYGLLAVLLLWTPGEQNVRLWLRGLREGPLAIDRESVPLAGS